MWKGDKTVPNGGELLGEHDGRCSFGQGLLLPHSCCPRAVPRWQQLPKTPMFPEMGLVAVEKQGANEQQKPPVLQHGLQSPPAALTGFITHEGTSGEFQGGTRERISLF